MNSTSDLQNTVYMPFASKNRIPHDFRQLGTEAEDCLIKREQFAISLRKKKKAEILDAKRKLIR
jgi:hypothetical protein